MVRNENIPFRPMTDKIFTCLTENYLVLRLGSRIFVYSLEEIKRKNEDSDKKLISLNPKEARQLKKAIEDKSE